MQVSATGGSCHAHTKPVTIGIDAHVLTGKYQGSRTWLTGMLGAIGRLDAVNRYVLYSSDPEATRRAFPFDNFRHRMLGISHAVPRLLLYWPLVQSQHGLDFLLTQYIAPPIFAGRQIVVVHDVLFESHPGFFPAPTRLRNQLLVRRSARQARLVLTVSDFSRREIMTRYGIPAERVVLTPNGIDVDVWSASPSHSQTPYILAVGRIEPRKNLATLLAAYRHVRARGLQLVVVGREDFGCDELVREMVRTPGVTHLRDVSAEMLDRLYANARALVFPSFAEGFGLPLLEALARGTPVIASNTTSMPEVCGRFARYFDPHAADATAALAAAIEQTLATPPSLAGVSDHIAAFSWDRSARRFIEAIGKLKREAVSQSSDAQMDVLA